MPRRIVVKKKDIQRRRAQNWEMHYKYRNMAKEMTARGIDVYLLMSKISRLPCPELDFDGAALYFPKVSRFEQMDIRSDYLFCECALVCSWYWSDEGWMEFVRKFQALDDPCEDYYFFYDAETDVVRLVPISGTSRGVVPETPKIKGISQVQVAYK